MNELLQRAIIEPLLERDALAARVAELGAEISDAYGGESVTAVAVMKGAMPFFVDLCRSITLPLRYDTLAVSSYHGGTESSGKVEFHHFLQMPIRDRHVLLVEDIIDTGRTMNHLLATLRARGPKSIRVVSLLDKPSRRVVTFEADWIGFTIPDRFVVGYGLDYQEHFRNLPDVGVLTGPPEIFGAELD